MDPTNRLDLLAGVVADLDAMRAPLARARADASRRRFERVCEPLRDDLARFVLWLARDRAIADDVVQETLLRAWRHVDSLADETAARSWLFTIARRELARLHGRSGARTEDIADLAAADEAAIAVAGPSDELEDVRRALWRLAEGYREPLLLQVDLGLSTQEIATELGLTRQAVLTRLFRAREQLRAALAGTYAVVRRTG